MPPPDQRSTKTKPPLPTFAPESARKCLAAPRVYASRGAGTLSGPPDSHGFRYTSFGTSVSTVPRRIGWPPFPFAASRAAADPGSKRGLAEGVKHPTNPQRSPTAIHSRMRHGLIPTLNDNRSFSAPKQATRSPWQRRGFDPFSNIKPWAPHDEATLSDGPGM